MHRKEAIVLVADGFLTDGGILGLLAQAQELRQGACFLSQFTSDQVSIELPAYEI